MRVFVYGTLTEPDTVGTVLDSFVFVGPATLHGLHAVDGRYPTLAPGGEVAGRLLRTDEIDALDAYENVTTDLYVRVTVPLHESDDQTSASATETGEIDTDGTSPTPATDTDGNSPTPATDTGASDGTVAVYVGDPDRLDAPADWPGDGPFPDRVRRHVRTHPVHVTRR